MEIDGQSENCTAQEKEKEKEKPCPSPGWTDKVCSEFNTPQLRVDLALNYFITVK